MAFMAGKGYISHPWIFYQNGFLELDLVACSLTSTNYQGGEYVEIMKVVLFTVWELDGASKF